MITYDELRRLNGEIVAEALRESGDMRSARLEKVRRICTVNIEKNDALKGRLKRDAQYQLRCQNIDARSQPLREILKALKEAT